MTLVVKNDGARKLEYDRDRLVRKLTKLSEGLAIHPDTFKSYLNGLDRQIQANDEIDFRDVIDMSIQNAVDFVMEFKDENDLMDFDKLGNTEFEFLAARILLNSLYKRASKNRSYDKALNNGYGDYYGLLLTLGEKNLVDPQLFVSYSPQELQEAGKFIVPERDYKLTYAGVYNMSERYLIRDKDLSRSVYELPQERYLTIALAVNRLEDPVIRMKQVKDHYEVMSKQEITMATPTFANAGRPDAQFSSCFILTTEDSLQGIYDDNTDAARLSKAGGGIGIYTGFLRSAGSSIKGNKGVSSGTVGWLKQLNNTAVSVNQLGTRAGAIAAYTDVFHADIESFLELRLNTGDQNRRAHELFQGLTIPDLFMTRVQQRGDWFIFDPWEVKQELGFYLQDFFDKEKWDGKGAPDKDLHAFSYHYLQAVDSNKLTSKKRIPAIELMKKIMRAQLETGLPYMFYRDTVNRDNPNNHIGMIYCSNLCSEIAENQSPTTMEEEYTENGKIVIYKDAGDLVVCNLSSTVLNNIFTPDITLVVSPDIKPEEQPAFDRLQEVVRIQTRATDNVIDVNNLPILQAELTNQKYRAIGLGEQGIAAVLATHQIEFDSHEATVVIEKIEKYIMLYAIEASADLGEEKGNYSVFNDSQWNTGEWLDRRFDSLDALDTPYFSRVREKAMKHMRNAYLRAVAPTGSTSLLAGSTAAADTVYDTIFFDGKKDSRTPVVAPGLNADSWFYYKPTMLMEYEDTKDLGHMWAIFHNEKRQPWVDQATSFNLYILDDISAINLLRLHEEIWSRGIKTSYYTRSHDASRVDACVACSA